MDECIYCGVLFDSQKGQGDHVIPCQFGEFRNDIRFRGICPTCNNTIGKSEQQLLQCSPEAWFRRIVKPAVPKRRQRGNAKLVGAHGAPPPENTIQLADHKQLVEPDYDNPDVVRNIDVLVLQAEDGTEDNIKLFPNMNAESLRRKIERCRVKHPKRMWVQCGKNYEARYQSLVGSVFPTCTIESLPDTPSGIHRVKGAIKFSVTDHYFRAIAKIGFHYYLCHTRRGYKGSEAMFASIRRFITDGGHKELHVSDADFRPGSWTRWIKELTSPADWHHVLSMDETSRDISAYVHLFRGKKSDFSGHKIRLATQDAKLEVPSFRKAHLFTYDENQQHGGGFAGESHPFPSCW